MCTTFACLHNLSTAPGSSDFLKYVNKRFLSSNTYGNILSKPGDFYTVSLFVSFRKASVCPNIPN